MGHCFRRAVAQAHPYQDRSRLVAGRPDAVHTAPLSYFGSLSVTIATYRLFTQAVIFVPWTPMARTSIFPIAGAAMVTVMPSATGA